MTKNVLITGGAGFIGSHTCVVLMEQGYRLVVLDNFDNSCPEALRRVQELAVMSNCAPPVIRTFFVMAQSLRSLDSESAPCR